MQVGKGTFITFEGGEGAGKSTQIEMLAERLRLQGHDIVVTREPGGSPGAEAVRHVLLSGAAQEFGVRMEALLFAAARSDHVEQVIRPALESGKVVLCDRFMDSTRVYQGVTGNLDPRFVQALERIAVNGIVPDLTIILDLPVKLGLQRAARRGRNQKAVPADAASQAGAEPDRFEREAMTIHELRRQAFLELAQNEPHRCKIVDAGRGRMDIARDIDALVEPVMGRPAPQIEPLPVEDGHGRG